MDPAPRTPRLTLVLGLFAAALAGLASLVGLLVPDFYHRDPALVAPQLLGQDLVTLVLAVPLLAWSARLAWRGSPRAQVALAGLLLYLAYTYATYAMGVRFNALFLVYVAVLGASTAALFLALARLPLDAATPRAWARLPRRALATLFFAIALVFVGLWMADVVPAMLSGRPPAAALETDTPTGLIHVMDLAFVLPLCVAAGVLLLRREASGMMLAGVVLVKTATLALAVLAMAAFVLLDGQAVNVPVAAAMLVTLALVLAMVRRWFAALAPDRDAPRAGRVPGGVAP